MNAWRSEFADGRSWGSKSTRTPLCTTSLSPAEVRVRALSFRADGSTGFCTQGRAAHVGEVVSVSPDIAETLVQTGKAERVPT